MILRTDLPSFGIYRGADRYPFKPFIILEEMDPTNEHVSEDIWMNYPPDNWRRNPYREFQEHSVHDAPEDFPIVDSQEVAYRVLRLIPPDQGSYEVLECWIYSNHNPNKRSLPQLKTRLIGFDLIYPGGDYFSAVQNGLHVNPDLDLKKRFGPILNEFGLFTSVDPISDYLEAFRTKFEGDVDSTFVLVELAET